MKWWKQFALMGALTTIPIFAAQATSEPVLDLHKNASILVGTVFDAEGTTPKHALKFSRYVVPEFINSKELVKGDYYCYTAVIASYDEQLTAIEAVSIAGFALARKHENAIERASEDILAYRCHAPSRSERFALTLTGLVHLIREAASDDNPWEAIVLEGEAEIDGTVQKIFVAKMRRPPIVS